jgi:hypothetical protein
MLEFMITRCANRSLHVLLADNSAGKQISRKQTLYKSPRYFNEKFLFRITRAV